MWFGQDKFEFEEHETKKNKTQGRQNGKPAEGCIKGYVDHGKRLTASGKGEKKQHADGDQTQRKNGVDCLAF